MRMFGNYTVIVAVACISTVLLASCELIAPKEEAPVLRDLSASEKSSVASTNTFGFELLEALQAEDPEGNLFISPLSVSLALGMTMNGAEGQTFDQMAEVLGHHGLSEKEINEAYRSLIDLLENLDPKVVFEIANSIWYREGLAVEPDFLDVNETYFDAEVADMDFSSPTAPDVINDWVDEKTRGKIQEVIDEIPPDVVMYLINAIYFKGTWTYTFEKDRTTSAIFENADGSESNIQLMMLEGTTAAYAGEGYRAVDLPYGDSLYSMTVILPDQDVEVNDVVEKLDDSEWQTLTEGLHHQDMTVQLPRFKLEYKVSLKDVLIALGMDVAFSNAADFSRIRASGDLRIDDVIHKTFVEVDEEGTEAAAVTVVIIVETSVKEPFRVDRPFVFAIRERHTGSILFIGKVRTL